MGGHRDNRTDRPALVRLARLHHLEQQGRYQGPTFATWPLVGWVSLLVVWATGGTGLTRVIAVLLALAPVVAQCV